MQNVIDKQKMEQLLISKWTEFLDYKKVMAFVMVSVRDHDDFPTYEEDDLPRKGVEITVTRCSPFDNGFLLWLDFTVPKSGGFAIGTIEAQLSLTGDLTVDRIIGHILKRR
jgi:hypothetical protein